MLDNDNEIDDSIASDKTTAIQHCVNDELSSYFHMLEGETPSNLHNMVMGQVESALFTYILVQCRGNQSKASKWLGISRNTLRAKLNQTESNNAIEAENLD